jgi:hypothetical protein
VPRRAKIFAPALAALLLLTFSVAQASASRAPTKAESAAIKKGFFKTHKKSTTKITRIRVSTADKRFSSVSYTINVPEPQRTAKAAKVYKPAPAILKKGSGKWKSILTGKAPKKVKKDFKMKDPRSDIQITGDVTATITRPAQCTPGGGSASIYDKASDIYLSIQFHGDYWKGPGTYQALSVGSVAGLYRNQAMTLTHETGQGNDAFASSGEIYVDGGGWGIINAGMAKVNDGTDTIFPQSVFVKGTWGCA